MSKGASASQTGLSQQAAEPASSLDPSGFDPLRIPPMPPFELIRKCAEIGAKGLPPPIWDVPDALNVAEIAARHAYLHGWRAGFDAAERLFLAVNGGK